MVIGLQHIQISIAPDQVEASGRFYIDLLGMRPINDPFPRPGGSWLAGGDAEVHIRAEADVDRRRTRAHPAFLVDDLVAAKHKLEMNGFETFPQPKIEGYDRFHVIDPSGNRIELMQKL